MCSHVTKGIISRESNKMTIKNDRHSFIIRVAAVLRSEARGKMKYETIKGFFSPK